MRVLQRLRRSGIVHIPSNIDGTAPNDDLKVDDAFADATQFQPSDQIIGTTSLAGCTDVESYVGHLILNAVHVAPNGLPYDGFQQTSYAESAMKSINTQLRQNSSPAGLQPLCHHAKIKIADKAAIVASEEPSFEGLRGYFLELLMSAGHQVMTLL